MDFCNGFSVMCAICRQREEVMKVKMPIKMQNSFFWIFTIFMLCGSHYGSLRRLCTPTLRKLTGCLIWNLRTGWNTLRCEFAALSQSLHPFLCFGSWHWSQQAGPAEQWSQQLNTKSDRTAACALHAAAACFPLPSCLSMLRMVVSFTLTASPYYTHFQSLRFSNSTPLNMPFFIYLPGFEASSHSEVPTVLHLRLLEL